MDIEKYIIIVTFIPWILIAIVSTISNLNNEHYCTFSLKYLGKNIFKIFRLDTLLLILCFWYFASFGLEFVDKYLFAIMCLYLFVNFFYEKKNSLKKGFFQAHIMELIILLLVISIPFIYYHNTDNLNFTYKIMLLYLFFEYITILVISLIAKLIKKIFKRKGHTNK